MAFILYNKTDSLKFPGIWQSAKAWFCLWDEKTQSINRVFLVVDDDAGAHQDVFTSVLLIGEEQNTETCHKLYNFLVEDHQIIEWLELEETLETISFKTPLH